MKRIEPASCLVYGLGNKLGRELLMEQLLILKGIMVLCERHRAGIKPAVDHLRNPVHLLSALRTGDGHIVDKRPVQLHLVLRSIHLSAVFLYHLGIVGAHFLKLFPASDAVHMSAFTLPYGKRRTPVAVSGNSPVLDILQPIAETSFSDGFRDPVDQAVVADQIVLYRRHLDKPGLSRVVDQRGSASPAVGIAVFKYRRLHQKSGRLQIL